MGNPNAPALRLKDTLQIIDNDTGKPVAYAAAKVVVVGKKISLKGKALPPGKKNGSVKWTWEVGQDALSDYLTSKDEGRPVDLSSDQLGKDQLDFYWYLGGKKTVALTADLGGGKQLRKQVMFDVHIPTIESFTWTNNTEVKVDDVYYDQGVKVSGEWIHFGGYPNPQKTGHDDPVPGIEYEAKVRLDSAIHGGTVYFVQLVGTKLDGETFPTIPMPGMDYTQFVLREGEKDRIFKGEDSPGGRLPTDQTTLQWALNNAFVTYVMFKPIGQNSIFVPLARLDWSVSALAARKDAKSKWSLLRKYEFPTPKMTIIQNRDLPAW